MHAHRDLQAPTCTRFLFMARAITSRGIDFPNTRCVTLAIMSFSDATARSVCFSSPQYSLEGLIQYSNIPSFRLVTYTIYPIINSSLFQLSFSCLPAFRTCSEHEIKPRLCPYPWSFSLSPLSPYNQSLSRNYSALHQYPSLPMVHFERCCCVG